VSIGPLEIAIVLIIALLVVGPNRLPQAGRSLGRAVREFRRATETAKAELGLDEVIEEFNNVKDGVASDFQSSGVNEALGTIKTAASIDLSAAGVAKAATAAVVKPAVDKPVQAAAPAPDVLPGDGDVPSTWVNGGAPEGDMAAAGLDV
jgi:sec-independent protein translocase protein TatA